MKDALQYGKAGEHLVCADLLMNGYEAYLSDQGLAYDVVLDHANRLYRIQVKSCIKPRNANSQGRNDRFVYSYCARRRGKEGNKRLNDNECDFVAFVGLDIRKVAYFLVNFTPTTLAITDNNPGTDIRFDDYPISLVLERENWIKKYKAITDVSQEKFNRRSKAKQGVGSNLTNKDVFQIKRKIMDGVKQSEIAKQFSVSQQTICGIKKGRTWKHINI